jgi:galactose-1-phosphate uridylyltransferase
MDGDFFKEYRDFSATVQREGEEQKTPEYCTRIDPLFGNVTKISKQRALRYKDGHAINVNLKIVPEQNCSFCNYEKETPEHRIIHESGAVSFLNLFPWEKYQWVTAYPPFKNGGHKVLLSEMDFQDLEAMIESEYDIAVRVYNEYKKNPDIKAITDFTNWGPFAGASKQHPHSQRQVLTHTLDPEQQRELYCCKMLAGIWKMNPFDVLIQEEIKDGKRVIFNNEDVYIGAAFAPRSQDEIIVIPKKAFSHIIQTNQNDRKFIRCATGIFPALRYYRGITDVNIAIHMAPLEQIDEATFYYRWHMHIYPRRGHLPVDKAGAELGYGICVSSTFPEDEAEVLRDWFKSQPEEYRVISPLKEEFKNHINGKQ